VAAHERIPINRDTNLRHITPPCRQFGGPPSFANFPETGRLFQGINWIIREIHARKANGSIQPGPYNENLPDRVQLTGSSLHASGGGRIASGSGFVLKPAQLLPTACQLLL
jgi:hypothetical protein